MPAREDYLKRSASYAEFKEKEKEKLFESYLKYFPELKGKCEVIESASPYTIERYTGSNNGSIYGLKISIQQPSLANKTSVRGFYLGGQSTLAPGLMGCVISSFIICANILRSENLWNEVCKCRQEK